MATPANKPVQPAWLTGAALAACAIAVWTVFGGARGFHFVLWDDDYNIQQNPHLSGLTWENLRWMFTDTTYSRRYFPLTWLGWNIEHDLFGLTSYSAHLGNVLFHLLNTVLVFFVIKTALRLWFARENTAPAREATVAATLGALLWALHPLRVEVVAWASGRIYGQAACFILVSAWCYLKAIESPPGSAPARRFRWAAAVALALSLLTYPLALSFVGVLLVLDWYLPGRLRPTPSTPPQSQLRALLQRNLPFILITAVVLGLTLWARTNVQAVGWKAPVTLGEFGVAPRFMQACYVWAYYLWKPLLPFDLSPYYTRLLTFSPGDWEFVVSFLVVAAITALLFLRRRRWPGLWLLWLCHLLILAPVLGLTEHPHFTNDRYSYVAAVPWSVGVAVLIIRFRPRWLAILVPAALLAGFAFLSVAQMKAWQNTETLGLHMIAAIGDHPRRFELYGRMAAALRLEGQVAESNAYYVKSLGGDPHAFDKILNRARGLDEQGQSHEAFAQYLLASQLRPDVAEPPYRLGAILLASDRAADALPFLKTAVRLDPGLADAQVMLGWAFNRTSQAPEAIPHFQAALQIHPDDAAAHSGVGAAMMAIGQARAAVPHLEWVVRHYPNSALAHFQFGLALLDGLGRNADAAAQFELSLKLDPNYPGVRDALDRSRH
ncbi:MAG: tetratricopeptide repeat protein [Opitutaceae bacterium]